MYESGIASINDKITTIEQAMIPALDRGFLFGDSIFEVFVGFHGRILDSTEHLKRLEYSAECMRMALPWSLESLAFELDALYAQVPFPKANLRLVVTRGAGLGLRPHSALVPHKMIYVTPATVEPPYVHTAGVSLRLQRKRHSQRGAAAKLSQYVDAIVAMQQHGQTPNFDDVLWLNHADEITEASSANIFFIAREGHSLVLTTPALHSGILSGITRQTLLHLFQVAGIRATEQVIYEEELARFDEAFLCSTVRGLVPVRQIQAKVLFTSRPTACFHEIVRLYQAHVTAELGFRVDWNTGAIGF